MFRNMGIRWLAMASMALALAWLPGATASAADGLLAGEVADSQGLRVDLTAEGTLDWAQWGLDNDPDAFNHKAGVPRQISTYTVVPVERAQGYTVRTFKTDKIGLAWTDGTPTPRYAGPTGFGVHNNRLGEGTGFEFTVPAGPEERILRVYVSDFDAVGRFEASLSDGSAEPYVNVVDSPGSPTFRVYTLRFRAAEEGATLTVRHILQTRYGDNANVTLQAATLSGS